MTKSVLILGGSGGIGGACGEQFARAGWRCALQYHRNGEKAESIAAAHPDCYALQADLTDPGAVRRLVSMAEYRMGGIGAVVYTAGTALEKPFADCEDGDFLDQYGIHVLGAVRVLRAALPALTESRGSIVLYSSMWGQVGASGESAYAAAKGAVLALTKSLAKELAVSGIRVNCVSPGLIDTPMNDIYTPEDLAPVVDTTPLSRQGTPEEAAAPALWLCSEAASFVTGQVIPVNGGLIL